MALTVFPVGKRADYMTAEPEAQHERADDDEGRIDGIAENQSGLPDPDDLVDETADAGNEKY